MTGTALRFASSVAVVSSLLAQTATRALGTTGEAGSSTSPDGAAARVEVTTRLVLLNVLVHHHGGAPVDGLSKDDFEVTDAGRPQSINAFSVNQLSAPNTRPAGTLPRNVVTNRPTRQEGAPPSVTVVLIDSYNRKVIEQEYVKRELLKSLKKLLPGDQVAIYTFNAKGFAIVHDFTNNAESVKAAAFDRGITGDDPIDAMLDDSSVIFSNFLTSNRIANTCAALRAVAHHVSGILGRKNLIWVTDGIPMDLFRTLEGKPGASNQNFASYVLEAGQALNDANVAIYPVDPRDMMSVCSFQASQHPDPGMLPRSQTTAGTSNMPSPPTLSCGDYDQNGTTMTHLAEITGGKAFHNIAHAVRQAIDDSAVTYTLGYYVPASDWNNGYHNVKVTVRRSGMNVRTKKCYLAQDKPTPNRLQLEAALNDALWSPLNSTRLSVTARIDPSPDLPNSSRFSFAIEPAELNLREEGGKYRGGADVLFMQEQKGGQHGAELMKTFHIALTPDRYKVLLASGMILTQDLGMQPDTVAVRIIVVDHSSGATGSVAMAVRPEDKSGSNVTPPAR